MRLTVLCFGHLTDYFGSEPLEIELPEEASMRVLAEALERRDPRAANLTRRCRFALNEEYVALETELHDGDVAAALPPMSGG